jgi:hypothetical protein
MRPAQGAFHVLFVTVPSENFASNPPSPECQVFPSNTSMPKLSLSSQSCARTAMCKDVSRENEQHERRRVYPDQPAVDAELEIIIGHGHTQSALAVLMVPVLGGTRAAGQCEIFESSASVTWITYVFVLRMQSWVEGWAR